MSVALDYNALILVIGSWCWFLTAVYMGVYPGQYPRPIASLAAFFGTLGFLASARMFNAGDPIEVVFSLLNLAVVLYAFGAIVFTIAVKRTYPVGGDESGSPS